MPMVHPHYTAIAMPRTGSTWLAGVLSSRGGGPRQLQHDPVSRLHPHAREGRVIVGTMRDPWSWYASIYAYMMGGPQWHDHLAAWGLGSLAFEDVMHGWTRDRSGCPDLAIAVVPGMTRADLIPGQGLWTSAMHYFYGAPDGWGVDILLDCAQLEPAARGLGLDGDMPGPVNTAHSKGRGYTLDGYTEEIAEWVEVADGALAKSLGYTSPGVRAHSPLIEPARWAA